jgi:hypothetical protein
MHSVKLNITDEIYEKFMGLVDILPKDSIEIEEIDSVPFYPSISFEEAKRKIETSVKNISKDSGKDVDKVFSEILS